MYDWRSAGLLFNSLNYFYRQHFGARVWKISIDAGCGCPNRDGRLATSGCVFCDPASFSPSRRRALRPIREQIRGGVAARRAQNKEARFIAYFQPGTNTYGATDVLVAAYREAVDHPDVVGLIVGTRPDCVSDEILDILRQIAQRKWLLLEFGLQSIHDKTLRRINRGHDYQAFLDAYGRSRARGLQLGVHVILGLPGETRDDMLATADALAALEIHSLKPHNLYAVHGTQLADEVKAGQVQLPGRDEYVSLLVDFLERLPAAMVIDRLCGDAPREYLLGPQWCLNKSAVREAVDAEFRRRGTWQGAATGGGDQGFGR